METKDISENGHKQVLSLSWELDGSEPHAETRFNWRGNRLWVRVNSHSARICTCIEFEFSFNYEHYSYKILYSNGTATKVHIPDICYENYRLVIIALPKSLEFYERTIITNTIPEGEVQKRDHDKIYFISVSKDFRTQEHRVPFDDDNLLLWIHKSFDHRYSETRDMFKYQFFSYKFFGTQLKEGNFTCLRITDFYQRIEGKDHFTVKCVISDNKNTVRSFIGNEQTENGVMEVIKLMWALKGYNDWEDYDYRKALAKSIVGTDWKKMSN